MFEVRKVRPLAGHKCVITRTCFRTYCECGWSSCAHWERREAYGEWREHILSHGGEREPMETTMARERRTVAKLMKRADARDAERAGDTR